MTVFSQRNRVVSLPIKCIHVQYVRVGTYSIDPRKTFDYINLSIIQCFKSAIFIYYLSVICHTFFSLIPGVHYFVRHFCSIILVLSFLRSNFFFFFLLSAFRKSVFFRLGSFSYRSVLYIFIKKKTNK